MPPGTDQSGVLRSKRKGRITDTACNRCRIRKCKCDGGQPSCSACFVKDEECVYELSTREKKLQLVAQNRLLEKNLASVQEALKTLQSKQTQPGKGSNHTQDICDEAHLQSLEKTIELSADLLPENNGSAPSLLFPPVGNACSKAFDQTALPNVSNFENDNNDSNNSCGNNEDHDMTTKDSSTYRTDRNGLDHVISNRINIDDEADAGVSAGYAGGDSNKARHDANPEGQDAATLLDALAAGPDEQSIAILAQIRFSGSWRGIKGAQALGSVDTGIIPSEPDEYTTETSFACNGAPARSDEVRDGGDCRSRTEYQSDWLRSTFDRLVFVHAPSEGLQTHPSSSFGVGVGEGVSKPVTVARSNGSDWGSKQPASFIGVAPQLRNQFCGLPFSSAIRANGYPTHIQAAQECNLYLPRWAIRTLNSCSDVYPDPFETAYLEMVTEMRLTGVSVDSFCGPHPYLNALDLESVYVRAPRLSQITIGITRSIKPEGLPTSTTQYGIMWAIWTLWKWILSPSPQNFRHVPELLRPTPWQVFVPHSRIFDFVLSPALRDHICQICPPPQRWLTQGCVTLRCRDPSLTFPPLCPSLSSFGEMDLHPAYKAHFQNLDNWSLGPSVKPFMWSIDRYFRVRPQD